MINRGVDQHATIAEQITALREETEERIQDMQALIEAWMAEQELRIEEKVEARLSDIVIGANGYADQGLQMLGGGLRALGVETGRRQRAFHTLRAQVDGLASQVIVTEDEIAAMRSTRDEHDALARVGQDRSGDLERQLRHLGDRVEFIRREVLYELQAALLRRGDPTRAKSRPFRVEVSNPEKLAAIGQGPLHVNIGCGHLPLAGYINVDRRDLPGVDIVAEATSLPIELGSVDEIISSHLMEHFSSHIMKQVLLPHWWALLKPGGRLVTVAPDGDAMVSALGTGVMSFEDFREVLFGAQDYDGDYHYNLLTPTTISTALEEAGFTQISIDYAAKRNSKCFEFRVSCVKRAE